VASEKILAKPRSGRSKRKGGLGEEIFARPPFLGSEAWARYGYNDWYSNEGWLAPSNYCFVLIGSNHPERNF
jgi:hypothetical protein